MSFRALDGSPTEVGPEAMVFSAVFRNKCVKKLCLIDMNPLEFLVLLDYQRKKGLTASTKFL